MKTRIKLLILMLLFTGGSANAQEEVRQVSLKIYLPIQFNAGNYQAGTYTWGRWRSSGIEVGLNLKKKNFEQEFILTSPKLETTNYYESRYTDSGTTYYYQRDHIQNQFGCRYQAGYIIFHQETKNLSVIPGLGIALNTTFAKIIDYYTGFGELDYKIQAVMFNPYLFTTVRYALSKKWTIESTFIYGPYSSTYVRFKEFGGAKSVNQNWNSNNYLKSFILGRFGVGYTF